MRRGGLGAAVALALVATLVSAIHPALLIALPFALLLVALPAARSPYRLIGVILLVALFAEPATGTMWYAERGWAIMLGAAFLAVVALRPGESFLHRGLAAVAVTTLLGALVLLLSGAWARVEWALTRRFRQASAFWTAQLEAANERSLEAAGDSAGAAASDPSIADFGATMQRVAELEVMLYPALLALGSLAALAVAWWCYRRLMDRSGGALSPMREFSFTDHLVWVLIAGAILLIVPLGEEAARLGANLATFMAALYVLRGAAIVLALTGATGVGAFLLGVVSVLLLPLFAGAALVIGLSDTWLDLRRRASSDDAASS